MTTKQKVPKRISRTVLNSLKGGVVPRIGLPYITVGRKNEIEALLHDVDIISEGGASFRFIVGRYGAGKSFLLQTIRNYVMDRGFVVADADLSPERRLQGTRGQGLATYRELIGNLSTKTKPEGGALTLVLDRWISAVQSEAAQETGLSPDDPALAAATDQKIYAVTASVSELVHGFEFAKLLSAYYHAYVEGDDDTKAKVVRWFRGEYALKREAKEDAAALRKWMEEHPEEAAEIRAREAQENRTEPETQNARNEAADGQMPETEVGGKDADQAENQ